MNSSKKAKMAELIEMYKSMSFLWNKSHPSYMERLLRNKAYKRLLEKYREIDEEGTMALLKGKLDNMRNAYIRELKKVRASRQTDPNNVYMPMLWYYDLFSFLENQVLKKRSMGDSSVEYTYCGDEVLDVTTYSRATLPLLRTERQDGVRAEQLISCSALITDEMWSTVESGGGDGARAAPCGRGKHSATLLGGHVYVLGGRGAGGSLPLRDFWRYSLATGIWERLECRGDPPPSLQEHSATAHEGKLYVFGGESALSNETPLWIYDTELQIWRKLPGQTTYTSTVRRKGARDPRGAGVGPRGRRGHTAHGLNDCLLIYGGYKDLRGSTNELWAFHYESESWHQVRTANTGPARHRHAAALHDNRLYVHAGQCDLRDCGDLWHYDTMSRVWCQVRVAAKLAPAPRSGHSAARAGAHLYIFGGEAHGHATNDMWRFHFATETWERLIPTLKWPSPRVDACALLVPGAPPPRAAPALACRRSCPRPEPPNNILREITKLSSFHIRRAARCSYSALAGDKDSTESLVRQEAALSKSHSAYVIDKRQPADGGESPREGDVPEFRSDMSREPISVPDFADMVLPTPVLSPVEATKLVYLDSEDEEDMRREMDKKSKPDGATVVMPKSASVRFTKNTIITDDEDTEISTSDYASAEKVNGPALGFSNPHYLGPDVRTLGSALTPDSGLGAGDIELQDLERRGSRRVQRNGESQLHLLLVGGKEPPHVALLQSPLSMWTYRLL